MSILDRCKSSPRLRAKKTQNLAHPELLRNQLLHQTRTTTMHCCPLCSKTLSTDNGVYSHMAQVHSLSFGIPTISVNSSVNPVPITNADQNRLPRTIDITPLRQKDSDQCAQSSGPSQANHPSDD